MVDFSRCHENWFEIEIQIWIEEVMFNSWIVLFLNYPRRFEFLRFLSFLAFFVFMVALSKFRQHLVLA